MDKNFSNHLLCPGYGSLTKLKPLRKWFPTEHGLHCELWLLTRHSRYAKVQGYPNLQSLTKPSSA